MLCGCVDVDTLEHDAHSSQYVPVFIRREAMYVPNETIY